MRPFLILLSLVIWTCDLHAQNEYGCGVVQFKKLTSIYDKHAVTDSDFAITVKLVKQLEKLRCGDYTGKKNGSEYVMGTRTQLFGDICLKKDDTTSVSEYINYLNRQHGSADENLSYQFERIFEKHPEFVLSKIGNNKYLLDHLVRGFWNNHYSKHLTTKNYKQIFFEYYSQLKEDYPQYKKQVDYLLHSIYLEVKR
ncbi:hypothetical protein [Mucilaginibacter sp.]|uniref:hypothetical protein n=1 Tax=Mucilaginibacter sp. TaxID=1882438 RepID=UPI002CF8E1B1|nr:hypothetical protein [Mucilaginibacter sp.]HTI59168.1 hypothetical protein [Mucilaginibacter sp.]